MNAKKLLNVSKIYLIVAFILLLSNVFLFYFYRQDSDSHYKQYVYDDLITSGSDVKNTYVSLDISYIPYLFLTRNVNNETFKYYFVVDKNNYMYIVRLTDETFNRIKQLYEENDEYFSYHLEGFIYNVDDNLKEMAIYAYNDMASFSLVNFDNFNKYFGQTYLDEVIKPIFISSIVYIIAFILLNTVACYLIAIYFELLYKNKLVLKIYNKQVLLKQLSAKKVRCFNNIKVYLTKDFIISNKDNLTVLKYTDILWVYSIKDNFNGVASEEKLIIYTKNKRYVIANSSKKVDDCLIYIIKTIKRKNKQVIIGYSKENKNKYKKLRSSYEVK